MTRSKRRYLLALVEGRLCVRCRLREGVYFRSPGWLCVADWRRWVRGRS